METPEVVAIEASSPEELATKLSALGLPDDAVAAMVLEVTGEEVEAVEEKCDCEVCNMSRTEKGMLVGKKLSGLLNTIKGELDLDFDTEAVMGSMGFVKTEAQTAEERDAEVAAKAREEQIKATGKLLLPVIKSLSEKLKMPLLQATVMAAMITSEMHNHGLTIVEATKSAE